MEITIKDINNYLLSKKILPNRKGFRYFRRLIELCLEDENKMYNNLYNLYSQIANEYDCSISSVIRNLNYCIETIENKTTISEFLAISVLALKGEI